MRRTGWKGKIPKPMEDSQDQFDQVNGDGEVGRIFRIFKVKLTVLEIN